MHPTSEGWGPAIERLGQQEAQRGAIPDLVEYLFEKHANRKTLHIIFYCAAPHGWSHFDDLPYGKRLSRRWWRWRLGIGRLDRCHLAIACVLSRSCMDP